MLQIGRRLVFRLADLFLLEFEETLAFEPKC
jgi:hypothetical protein